MKSAFKERLQSIFLLLCFLLFGYAFFWGIGRSALFFQWLISLILIQVTIETWPLFTAIIKRAGVLGAVITATFIAVIINFDHANFNKLLLVVLGGCALFYNRRMHLPGYTYAIISAFLIFNTLALRHLVITMSLQQYSYLLSLQAIASMADSFAYFAGVSLNAKPLNLPISPKKTTWGFLAAIIVTPIFYTLLQQHVGFIQPFTLAQLLALTVLSIIGDFIYSLPKRLLAIKDYSNILPGHGGLLDRLDSVFTLLASSITLSSL